MKKTVVKVFDAYHASHHNSKYYKENYDIRDFFFFDYHNQVVNKKGIIKPCKRLSFESKLPEIKPLRDDIVEKVNYELEDDERLTLSMLKDTEKQLKELYDSSKRKKEKYEKMLLDKIIENSDDEVFEGEYWDCHLSPLGRCIYHYEYDEPTCIFCGEPEERK